MPDIQTFYDFKDKDVPLEYEVTQVWFKTWYIRRN